MMLLHRSDPQFRAAVILCTWCQLSKLPCLKITVRNERANLMPHTFVVGGTTSLTSLLSQLQRFHQDTQAIILSKTKQIGSWSM